MKKVKKLVAFIFEHSSIAIILMGNRELTDLLNLSSWCLVMVEWLFLVVPLCCLRFVIVVFPDHTHLLFLYMYTVHFSYYVSQISIFSLCKLEASFNIFHYVKGSCSVAQQAGLSINRSS